MEIRQMQKYVIASPKKIREVIPMIKNLNPVDAYEKLPFLEKRAGEVLRKVIGTALANAKQKQVKEKNLFFKEIQINEGPVLKRWRAGARGMAKPYKKRMSHIRIVLGVREEDKVEKKRKAVDERGNNTEKNEKSSKIKSQKSKNAKKKTGKEKKA